MPLPLRPRPGQRLRRDLLATTAVTLALALASTHSALAQASGTNAYANGANASATGTNAYASGTDASATGTNAYASGTSASASGTNTTAVGSSANASSDEAFAGGYNARAMGAGSVAIGSGSKAQSASGAQNIYNFRDDNGIGNAAAGTGKNNDLSSFSNGRNGNTTPQNESNNGGATPSGTAIGQGSSVGPGGGVAIGYNNIAGSMPGSYNSTAIGSNNVADGRYSLGAGYSNYTEGVASLALGTNNQALGDISIALGRQSYAYGQDSIAQGFVASAYGQDAIALGRLSVAGEAGDDGKGTNATTSNIAIGNYATAIGGSALAIGANASAKNAKSVAIGAGSMALRGTISGTEAFSGNALSSAVTEFSVGASGATRQITNVAGGQQDTDAVNVGQLRGLGNTLGTTLGSSFNATTNAYTVPSYTYGSTTTNKYSTIPSVVGAIDNYGLRYDTDGTNRLASIDLTRGGAVGKAVSITGLAPATTDSGAVALSQMPLRYSTASSPTTDTPATASNDVTLVGSNRSAPVALHNLAPGNLAAGSTDAVNGSQLYTTNQSVATTNQNVTNLQNGINNGTIGLVQQASNNTITVAKATGGNLVDFTGTDGTRRLTGLANGIGDADAATFGQLRLSSNALGGGAGYDSNGNFVKPSYKVGDLAYNDVGSALTATNNLAVQYVTDGSGNLTNVVNLARAGGSPVALRGVAAGNLTSDSTDAVNGSQLYSTNQNVAALQNGTAGLVQQATSSSPITVGAGSAGTVVNFTNNANQSRTLTGVAAGRVASGSTDAVNGGQLYETNQSIANANQNVTNLQSGIDNGTVGLVQQDQKTRTITVGSSTDGRLVDLTGKGGTRRLTGLANGIGDADAATFGQLRLASNALGGGAGYDANGIFIKPSYTVGGQAYNDVGSALAATNNLAVQYVAGNDGKPTNVVDLARGGATPVALRGVADGKVAAGSTDAVNGGQLYSVSQSVTDLQNGTTGLVRQDPTTRVITVGGATDGTTVSFADKNGAARTLTDVAAGQITKGSTQAVNGGQVYAVTASLGSALGGGAGVASDGTLTAPSYLVQGSTYNNVGGALGGLDAAVTSLNTNGSKYVAVHSTGAAARAIGADTVAIGPAAVTSADRGVALGAGAVASRAGLSGAKEAFTGVSVASTQGAVSVGDAGAERQITNVAGGTQDTDAVNLRQLRTVGTNVAGALGGGAGFADDGTFTAPSYGLGGKTYRNVGDALGAVDTFGVRYDVDPTTGGRGQSLALAGGDPNQPVLIRNVASGVLPTDAANVGQVTQAKADANAYTDRSVAASYAASTAYTDAAVAPLQSQLNAFGSQLADMNRQIGAVRTEARRAAAIGLAAASLRFDDRPGKLSVAAGGGAWRGEAAASFGVGYTLPDGSARVNATGVAAGRDFGVGAGASFTLN